jgi:hypothetical protein
MHQRITNYLTLPLIAVFLIISTLVPVAQAKMIDTQEVLSQQIETPQTTVQTFLDRSDVRDKLVSFGVDPDYASERVAALTDQELRQLQSQINDLPAGGDVLAVIGIVFVVLLILELVGVTHIFTSI